MRPSFGTPYNLQLAPKKASYYDRLLLAVRLLWDMHGRMRCGITCHATWEHTRWGLSSLRRGGSGLLGPLGLWAAPSCALSGGGGELPPGLKKSGRKSSARQSPDTYRPSTPTSVQCYAKLRYTGCCLNTPPKNRSYQNPPVPAIFSKQKASGCRHFTRK